MEKKIRFTVDTNKFDDGTPRGLRKGDTVITKEIDKDSLQDVINIAGDRYFVVEQDEDKFLLQKITDDSDVKVDDISRMFLVVEKEPTQVVYCMDEY